MNKYIKLTLQALAFLSFAGVWAMQKPAGLGLLAFGQFIESNGKDKFLTNAKLLETLINAYNSLPVGKTKDQADNRIRLKFGPSITIANLRIKLAELQQTQPIQPVQPAQPVNTQSNKFT